MKRFLKIIIESLAGLFSGVFLLLGLLVVFMIFNRVEIDFLTEELERAFNESGLPLEIDIESTDLVWGGWEQVVEIQLGDVKLYDLNRRHVLSLQQVDLDLNLLSLLTGQIAPTRLQVDGGELTIRRLQDGSYDFLKILADSERVLRDRQREALERTRQVKKLSLGFEIPEIANDQFSAAYGRLLDIFSLLENVSYESYVFRDLQDFKLSNYNIHIEDIQNYRKSTIRNANFALYQEDTDTVIALDGILDSDGDSTVVTVQMLHPVNTEQVFFDVAASDFSSENVVSIYLSLSEMITDVDNMDFVLSGEIIPGASSYDIYTDAVLSLKEGLISFQGKMLDWGHVADVAFEIDQINSQDLIKLSPYLADNIPFSGNLQISGETKLKLYEEMPFASGVLDFSLTNGSVNKISGLLNKPKAFKKIKGKLTVAEDVKQVSLDDLAIELADVTINLQAALTRQENLIEFELPNNNKDVIDRWLSRPYEAQLRTYLKEFDASKLPLYWPETVAEDARKWIVENIPEANIKSAHADLKAIINFEQGVFDLVNLNGALDINNAAVHFFRPLPPAENVSAIAAFGPNWFDIDVLDGQLEEIDLKGGNIYISDIGVQDLISIDLDIEGPASNALSLLDHNPLNLISKMGAKISYPQGDVSSNLKFDFELLNDLDIDDVLLEVVADIKNASAFLPDAQKRVASKHLDLDLTKEEMILTGDIIIDENVFQASWYQSFIPEKEILQQYEISGNLNTDFIKKQAVDISNWVDGYGDFAFSFQKMRDEEAEMLAYIDVTEAELSYDKLELNKPVGQEGSLFLHGRLSEESGLILDEIEVDSDALYISGDAQLAMSSKGVPTQLKIHFSEVKADKTDVSAHIEVDITEKNYPDFEIDIDGTQLNISKFAELSRQENAKAETDDSINNQKNILDNSSLRLGLAVEKLYVIEERNLFDASVELVQKSGTVDHFMARMHASTGDQVSIDYSSDIVNEIESTRSGKRLIADISNWGQFLNDLGITEKVVDGNGVFNGVYDPIDGVFIGELAIENYEFRDAPALAKIVSAVSLTGLPAAIAGGNMEFNRLDARLQVKDDILKLEKAVAHNTSIGLSVAGEVNLSEMTVNGQGTVIPAYGLNQLIGNVPLLGWILTGGDGGGLFGAVFYLTGPLQELEVNLNPASVFTPGVLRRFFDLDQSNEFDLRDRGGNER